MAKKVYYSTLIFSVLAHATFLNIGVDHSDQTTNPSNECQLCDLFDSASRANRDWSNRPAVPCDDHNKCTKQDTCIAGRFVTIPVNCQ